MMEESMGFVWPGDISVVEGEDVEPVGSGYAGKKRLALRIRATTLVVPNERFARFVARSRGVSCDTDLGVRVGIPTAFGHVMVPAHQKGGREVQVQGREVEDHARIELHPDTHILLGYFDPFFCEGYVRKILVMPKTPISRGVDLGWPCITTSGLIL